MSGTKKGTGVRPGIPMSEDALREWKKTFSDIEESINNLYEGEDREHNAGRDCRPLCEEDCKE